MNPFMTRMTVNQRWQHLILLSSFIILVITGFALKFPDTWFAHTLGMGENLRGIIHRVAGVILIAAGIYHVFYLAVAREGRRLLRDIAPAPQRRIRRVGHHALLPRPQRARSRNSAASTTPKKPSTGRSSGALPSWASPAS